MTAPASRGPSRYHPAQPLVVYPVDLAKEAQADHLRVINQTASLNDVIRQARWRVNNMVRVFGGPPDHVAEALAADRQSMFFGLLSLTVCALCGWIYYCWEVI